MPVNRNLPVFTDNGTLFYKLTMVVIIQAAFVYDSSPRRVSKFSSVW